MTVYARAAHTHRQRAATLISVDVDADLEARSKVRQAASVPPAPGLPNSVRFIEAGWKKEAEFSTNDIFQIFFFFKKTNTKAPRSPSPLVQASDFGRSSQLIPI